MICLRRFAWGGGAFCVSSLDGGIAANAGGSLSRVSSACCHSASCHLAAKPSTNAPMIGYPQLLPTTLPLLTTCSQQPFVSSWSATLLDLPDCSCFLQCPYGWPWWSSLGVSRELFLMQTTHRRRLQISGVQVELAGFWWWRWQTFLLHEGFCWLQVKWKLYTYWFVIRAIPTYYKGLVWYWLPHFEENQPTLGVIVFLFHWPGHLEFDVVLWELLWDVCLSHIVLGLPKWIDLFVGQSSNQWK